MTNGEEDNDDKERRSRGHRLPTNPEQQKITSDRRIHPRYAKEERKESCCFYNRYASLISSFHIAIVVCVCVCVCLLDRTTRRGMIEFNYLVNLFSTFWHVFLRFSTWRFSTWKSVKKTCQKVENK